MCKLSVIIPYFNRENSIERAINSVLNQSFDDYEIILINDGSTDNSEIIVNKLIQENKNKLIRNINQKNMGVSVARNKGIILAKGEYIAFLDSDDTWNKEKTKLQLEFMDKNKDISILGTDYNIYMDDKVIVRSNNKKKFIEANYKKMLFKNFFTIPSVIVKKDILLKEKIFFDEYKFRAEDQLFFLRIIKNHRGGKITIPLINLYKFEAGSSGLSGDLLKLQVAELDNFKKLYKEKQISMIVYVFSVIFASIKFIRRLIICKIRNNLFIKE
ncbi:glycosyltransferase family 2 protein [Clostridium botulinum]|uniref:glycosyltransferase family 2 protein n=1 Tax=Clostridium botulinum TaxID=1491 RepID=UPI0019675AA0|nr:glycosyltransferase family 2 protein [Clostridium botulinum]MBN1072562.1 glycosyltransferase family 2 protein [Clostridium botulinum]